MKNSITFAAAAACIAVSTPHAQSGRTYGVGDGLDFRSIGSVPWEQLQAGDTVLVHARPEPYHEKWVICRQGREDAPITIRGVPGPDGSLPVIDGRDAVTPSKLNFWGEERAVIKIGGANAPPDLLPQWIVVENLEIRNARPPFTFTGRSGTTPYARNAAGIFIEKGANIIIRNCMIRNCGNGLFCAFQTINLLVEACDIFDNGITNSIFEHNVYTEANGIVFQFNRLGPLRELCGGNNLKDRSAACVIRWNWIEGGNRQLDLVDSDHQQICAAPAYRSTFVYGNILIEPEGAGNSQIVHYGGDSGRIERYRKGALYFFNNTVISKRTGNTTLFRLSTDEERCDCRNNIFHATADGRRLALLDDSGVVELHNNWIKTGWRPSHNNPAANIRTIGKLITGELPGFAGFAAGDYSLLPDSPCRGAGAPLNAETFRHHPLNFEYVPHRMRKPRPECSLLDLGAL